MGDAPDEDPHHGRTPRDDPSKLSIRVQAELARIKGKPFNGNDYSKSLEDDPDEGYRQVDDTDQSEILRYHRSIKDTSAANQRNHLRNLRILATNKHFDGPLTEQDHETLNDLVADLAADRNWGQGTERNYAISLGAFLRNRGHEDVADNLNVPDPERPDIDPDEVLAWDEDIVPLMDASRRTRDAALIATLWESGNRITTISSLTVGDYNQVGDTHALLSIPETEGDKDAGGHIKPLVVARAAIDRWLAGEHPCPDDDDAALFCSIRPQDPDGAHISPPAIRQLLKRIAERAETIDADRVSPHAFRHSRATYMRASDRFDSIDIEQTMAWVEGSEQHSRYENVEQEKAANRILRKQGIATEETEEADVDVECPRCNIVVPAGASYCPSCSLRLTDTGQPRWFRIYREYTDLAPEDDPILDRYDDDIPPENIAELPQKAFQRVLTTMFANMTTMDADDSAWVRDNIVFGEIPDQHLDKHQMSYALSDVEIPEHVFQDDESDGEQTALDD